MKALVVGGNSGVGLAIVFNLLQRGYEHVYIAGKGCMAVNELSSEDRHLVENKTSFQAINLICEDYSVIENIQDINTLIITAGFGRVAPFDNLTNSEITNLIKCNELAPIKIIKMYYDSIISKKDFYCAVMGSIAGHVASPLFSVYGATKAGLSSFIESINGELNANGCVNRVLEVAPGSIKGTSFNGGETHIDLIKELANNIVHNMLSREELYIPDYEGVYEGVIRRYRDDPKGFSLDSHRYKIDNNRINNKPQTKIGYLSGTFDLFHIGHLNLLRRAKQICDYLIVGVHESGAWKGKQTFISLEERMEIVSSIKYVDEVIVSYPEDSDAYEVLKYDVLFVGSDYKNSERFLKYEKFFEDKNVEIVYFPYTKGTSSTQLRKALEKGS